MRLDDPGVEVELTATNRVGLHRYRFPASDEAHVVLDLVHSIYDYDGKVLWSEIRVESDRRVTGLRRTKGWAPDRHLYFAIEFSKRFSSWTIVDEHQESYLGFGPGRERRHEDYREAFGRGLRAHFDFETAEGEEILVKVAISPVGIDGAVENLETEVPGWDFDAVRRAARQAWERELGRIEIDADPKTRRIFYTARPLLDEPRALSRVRREPSTPSPRMSPPAAPKAWHAPIRPVMPTPRPARGRRREEDRDGRAGSVRPFADHADAALAGGADLPDPDA